MDIKQILILLLSVAVHCISASVYTCDQTSSCGCSFVPKVTALRIVGGESAGNNTWSWMVSLRLYGLHRCGASLISAEYAITAAHCVDDVLNNPSLLTIAAGTNYLSDRYSSTFQKRTVTRIVRHPDYNANTTVNDIAIIQFSPLTVTSEKKLAFICLHSMNQDPFETNTNLVAIGWGVTHEDNDDVSNYLQQVTVKVYADSSVECARSGRKDISSQFCAGVDGGGKDTCQGDSGGPLMAFVNKRWVLAGLTSMGEGCARAGFPGVYTRVSKFISFINENTGSDTSDGVKESTASSAEITPGVRENTGNVLNKSVLIAMFWFASLMYFSISFFNK